MINESPLSNMGLSTQGPLNTVYGIGALGGGYVAPDGIVPNSSFNASFASGWNTVVKAPVNAATQPTNNMFGWSDVFKQLTLGGFATTQKILSERFGGPQPGQYFQNQSGVAYALPQGANATLATFPGIGIQGGGINLSTLILLMGGGLLLVSAMKR